MPVTFPTASSTACLHSSAVFTPPTALSICLWYKVASAGSYQNFLNLGTAPNIDFYFGTNGNITLDRDYSGTNARWNLTVANQGVTPSNSDWRFLAVTQGGALAAPTWYHSAVTDSGPVVRTGTVGTTPTGTVVTSGTHALHIGNYNAHDAGFGGPIAYLGIYSVQLTEGEVYEHMWRGWTGRGVWFHSPLDTTAGPDLSGNAVSLSVNGSAATYTTDGPPVVPAWTGRRLNPSLHPVSSGPQSLTLNAGKVAVKGGAHTIAPGPVGLTLNAGKVATKGGLHSVSDPARSLTLQAGKVGVKGGLHTITPGPVTLVLQAGKVAVKGAAHTITPGPVALVLQAGKVAVKGGLHTLYDPSGPQNVVLVAGRVAVKGGLHSLVPGAVGLTLQAGKVAIKGGLHAIPAMPAAVVLQAGKVAVKGALLSMSAVQSFLMNAGKVAVKGGLHAVSDPTRIVGLSAGKVAVKGGLHSIVYSRTIPFVAGRVAVKGGRPAITGGTPADPPAVITYGLQVHWDNSTDASVITIGTSTIGGSDRFHNPLYTNWQVGTYDDLSSVLKSFTIDRGRSSQASAEFSGRAEFVLHDPNATPGSPTSGRLNPLNEDSELWPDVKPNRLIRLRATYDGTTYPLFQGVITRIRHIPQTKGRASYTIITAEDVRLVMARQEVVADAYTGDASAVVYQFLNAARIPIWDSTRIYRTDVDGSFEFAGWGETSGRGSALAEVNALMEACRGQFYIDAEGHPCFDPRAYRQGSGDTPTSLGKELGTVTSLAAGIQPTVSGDSVVNRVTVQAAGQGFHPQVVEDATSQIEYGLRDVSIGNDYIQDDADAMSIATYVLAERKDAANEAQSIELKMSSRAAIVAMLSADLNDHITIVDSYAAIDSGFWVEGVSHSASTKGDHSCKLTVTRELTSLPSITLGGT